MRVLGRYDSTITRPAYVARVREYFEAQSYRYAYIGCQGQPLDRFGIEGRNPRTSGRA
jgi:hypothetical protein